MIHRMRGRAPRSFISASSYHGATTTAITARLRGSTIVGRSIRLLSSSGSDSGSGEGNGDGPDYAAFWKFLTVEQLKLACKHNFLPTSGRKSVLVDRLVNDEISPKYFLKWYSLWERSKNDSDGNGLNLRSDDKDSSFFLLTSGLLHTCLGSAANPPAP